MSKKSTPSGISTSTSASPPAGGQRLIQTLLKQDKEQEKGTLQTIVQGIQDLKTKLDNMEQRMEQSDGNVKQMMAQYEKRFQKIEDEGKQREEKIGNIDTRLTIMEQEKSLLLRWEVERSEFYLRFQNIEEEKGQNLAEIMIGLLAEVLEITEEKMRDGVDEVYRVYTRYAMRNNLPREVHIRFTKRSMKTQILQAVREKTLKYKGKEIVVLKQIPRRIREMRREYRFLTKILMEKDVNYRWLIPEGLMFMWQGQRHRIDSVEKAVLFQAEFFGKREEIDKEVSLIEFQEEQLDVEKEEGAVGGQVDGQRELRSTRAVRPKYKA